MPKDNPRHRLPVRLLGPVAVGFLLLQLLASASPAEAFVTANHTKITLDAVTFEKATSELAARAVNVSDKKPWGDDSREHCDNADYLTDEDNGGKPYPRSRLRAFRDLQNCAQYAYTGFIRAVSAADGLVDAAGAPVKAQVEVKDCKLDEGPDLKKCEVLDGLGRSWHAIEDFYAHSNYADKHDLTQKVSHLNAPGLAQSAPAPIFDMAVYRQDWSELNVLAKFSERLDPRLITGCYHNDEDAQGDRNNDCEHGSPRVTHQDDKRDYQGNGVGLAKDSTVFQRAQLPFSEGKTNFTQVMEQATAEIKHQWTLFHDALVSQYGQARADGMVKAITTDHPAAG
ncbi:hypothetical protein ACFVVL_34190 [Kitasatospora sp. NPDC058115]|uniref:hypothetical protein n=1 Tax=Kitasatospora sp. NPDC058115 TaxID=3346347 RepID=UPI0036DB91E1